MKRITLIWFTLIIAVVGCAAPTGTELEAVPPTEDGSTSIPTAEALKPVTDTPVEATAVPREEVEMDDQPAGALPDSAAALEAVEFAATDLANQLGIEASTVTVVSYEDVAWNDGALGCPQPDMMYTQAVVDGFLIELEVNGELFSYHGAHGRDPFLCSEEVEGGLPRSGELATPPGS